MITKLILAFLLGYIIKTVDNAVDENKKTHFIFVILYGLILGFLLHQENFFNLGIGLILAQIFSKKIDAIEHVFGVGLGILILFYLGIPNINFPIILGFLIFGIIDEWVSDNKKFPRIFSDIFSLSIFFISWDYFLYLIFFDLGYIIKEVMD